MSIPPCSIRSDPRRRESELAFETASHAPVLGIGLGVIYRDKLYTDIAVGTENEDSATFAHNIYAHRLLKYGFLGLAAFSIFPVLVFRSLLRAVRDTSSIGDRNGFLCRATKPSRMCNVR